MSIEFSERSIQRKPDPWLAARLGIYHQQSNPAADRISQKARYSIKVLLALASAEPGNDHIALIGER